jgi:diaminopimelate epimerase
MRFFNPDGTEVELCGNGSRCVAAFAKKIGAVRSSAMTIETIAGLVDAEVISQDQVRIWMPEPTDRRYSLQVHVEDRVVIGDFVRVGVPHFVVQVPSVAKVDVMKEGRALRLSDAFAPNGTNVDFVRYKKPNNVYIRTYERGVESETGACGTGAVSASVIGVKDYGIDFPVNVVTSHGYTLIVDGVYDGTEFSSVTLTGPVKKVFEGEISWDSLDAVVE